MTLVPAEAARNTKSAAVSRAGNRKEVGMAAKVSLLVVLLVLLASSTLFAVDYYYVLRISAPPIASGAVGIRWGSDDAKLKPALQGEVGVAGGKLTVGLDNTLGSGLGYGIKASMLRTWIKVFDIDKNQSFFGIEGELSFKHLVFSIGPYRRVSGGKDSWILGGGVGLVIP